jgi:Flp pilus assembly protein TadD
MIPESVAVEFDRIDGTAMFDTLGRVRALPVEEVSRAIVCRSPAESYGLSESELFAIAEIGRHYLESGGYKLASLIFEGLEALDPEVHYFAMALGLTRDRLGDKAGAISCYRKAQRLDPKDARADLNLAELLIEAGQRREAIALIQRAEQKAVAAEETQLAQKARALLMLLGVTR